MSDKLIEQLGKWKLEYCKARDENKELQARIKELEDELVKVYKALDHLPIDIDELLEY